ncbi:MAG TPA: hypothetical protein VEH31_16890, partial [Streptosporangiaceae bacterium]|nr:hypothetical protein [Streptosporangiaceae bacterium]
GVFGGIPGHAERRTREGAEGEGRRLRHSKVRVRVEMAIALFAGVLGILTIFWHDWIELLTGWDPDHHNGSVEWILVVALLAVAATMGFAARRHWRLLTADPQQ